MDKHELSYPNLIRLATYYGKGSLDHKGQRLALRTFQAAAKLRIKRR